MKYLIIFPVLFCLLSTESILAKPTFNVEILVKDSYTGNPISNVEITIDEMDQVFFTDASGKIYLNDRSEEELSINISHEAYRNQMHYEYFKKRQREDKSFVYRLYPNKELLNQYLQPIIAAEISELQKIDSTQYLPCDQDSTPIQFEAHFPGGMKMFQEYIKSNLNYPEESIDMGEQGKVFLSFVIEKNGVISNIKVERGVSRLLDREAKRMIQEMPNWIPAYCNGRPQMTQLRIPLRFALD